MEINQGPEIACVMELDRDLPRAFLRVDRPNHHPHCYQQSILQISGQVSAKH